MLPLTAAGPGEGPHWERLAEWLRERLPVDGVDGVWVFRVLRRDQREFGTAVISQVEGERRRIYTARYSAIIKGKQRGGFESWMEEVGSGPLEALHELLALVPVRADDEDPPTPVDPARWFPPVPDLQLELEPLDDAGEPATAAVEDAGEPDDAHA